LDEIPPIAQFGLMGVVLLWFMLRMEVVLKDLTRSVDASTRAITRLITKNSNGNAYEQDITES
jgi:hypothetical protein